MTVIAGLPVSPAGSTLAPYTAANGDVVLPGCYGVSHGSGITGELIRHATESWAGHQRKRETARSSRPNRPRRGSPRPIPIPTRYGTCGIR